MFESRDCFHGAFIWREFGYLSSHLTTEFRPKRHYSVTRDDSVDREAGAHNRNAPGLHDVIQEWLWKSVKESHVGIDPFRSAGAGQALEGPRCCARWCRPVRH